GEVLAPTTQDRDAAVKVVPRTEGALLVEHLVSVDRYRAVPDRPSTGLLRVDEAGRDERIEQSGAGGDVRPGKLGGRVDESLLRERSDVPSAEQGLRRGLDRGRRLRSVHQGRDVRGQHPLGRSPEGLLLDLAR